MSAEMEKNEKLQAKVDLYQEETAMEEANMTQLEAQKEQNGKLKEDLDQQREEIKKMQD